jgi:uncharacterized membrane protein YdjX (TVP38/TMEM64 family)
MAIVFTVLPPVGSLFLLASLGRLGPWIRAHEALGALIYFGGGALLIGLSLLPTYACAILAGWAFGFWIGTPLAVVTVTVGAILAYALGRMITRDRFEQFVRAKPRWNALHRSLLSRDSPRTRYVVALLRIPPTSPFGLANYVLAAAGVALSDYVLGTFIGVIPRTAATCYAAAALQKLTFEKPAQSWIAIGGIAATLVACLLLGFLANRALRRQVPGAV